MSHHPYPHYNDQIETFSKNLRNSLVTAICVMVTDGHFNGPDQRPRDIMLHDESERLYLEEWCFDHSERVCAGTTTFKIVRRQDGLETETEYPLEELPIRWLMAIFVHIF